jgi:alkylation response protein AidB-like acyl-CoA dehydrogenase
MSGSDAATMQSRAVLNDAGTHYVINGRKSWVTSGPVADFVALFTMTDPEKGAKGASAFLIDTRLPGFIRGKKEPKLGIRASATSELVFDNYLCPVENMLGQRGGLQDRRDGLTGRIVSSQARIAERPTKGVQYARRRHWRDWRETDDPAEDRRYEDTHRGQPSVDLQRRARQRA